MSFFVQISSLVTLQLIGQLNTKDSLDMPKYKVSYRGGKRGGRGSEDDRKERQREREYVEEKKQWRR